MTPAQAGTCGGEDYRGGRAPTYCKTERRINYNGHSGWDGGEKKGKKFTLVFWDDNTVEIVGLIGQPITGYTYTDRQGDTRIEVPAANFEMAIRL